MMNRTLHALSNRTVFKEPLFVADPHFSPARLSDRAEVMRKSLFLDNVKTDYYLRVYLGILEAYPDLKAQLQDTVTSYRMTDFIPRGVWIDGGELVSAAGARAGFFTDPDNTTLPINLTYNIDFKETGLCTITAVEKGTVKLAACQLVAVNPGPLLQVDWPEDIPFQGIIKLTQAWTFNSRVLIEVVPSRFPYAALIQRVNNSPYLSELLGNYNMIDGYASSLEPVEKLAIVLTLMALANPAAYNP